MIGYQLRHCKFKCDLAGIQSFFTDMCIYYSLHSQMMVLVRKMTMTKAEKTLLINPTYPVIIDLVKRNDP